MSVFKEIGNAIISNVEKVVIGKRTQILQVLSAILARGHVLLEDVPGVAKTMLARSLTISFGCDFKRVQCTPDLLPTDLTGVSVFNQKRGEFEFVKGPLFTNVLLSDEINRATPRTQSALLEAMEEKQVSVDGVTYRLANPFIVIATQNPVEQEGTFPLPEAQIDRFLIRISLGYPEPYEESEMLDRLQKAHPIETLGPVSNAQMIEKMQHSVRKVFLHEDLKSYILKIVHATRHNMKIALGASPRASIALYHTAQAIAALDGRDYVIPDDVKNLIVPVLAHRLILYPEYRLRHETPESVIREIVDSIGTPWNTSSFRGSKTGLLEEQFDLA